VSFESFSSSLLLLLPPFESALGRFFKVILLDTIFVLFSIVEVACAVVSTDTALAGWFALTTVADAFDLKIIFLDDETTSTSFVTVVAVAVAAAEETADDDFVDLRLLILILL
jgi:hypothetical protein